MRTKLTLLFFSFFFAWKLSAQGPLPQLQVITDYAKCFYGLKDKSGKQIWKTEFTYLKEGSLTDKRGSITDFFWIAEKNGLYGALNNDGHVIVPFEYSKITFFRPGWFVGFKQGSAALYSFSGEQKSVGTELDDITPVRSGFIVTKNGKSGFFDLQFGERIPISYTKIEPVMVNQHLEDQLPVQSTYLLRISEGSNQGIYDLNRKLIIPCKYEFVEEHWANVRCDESQAVYVAFRSDSRVIFNSEGTFVDSLELDEYPEFYHAPLDSCATKALTFCLVRRNTNYETGAYQVRVVNLQTGERSESFDEVYANGNRILCRSGKTWSVLDEHLKELKHWDKWQASWQPVQTRSDEPIRQYSIPEWHRKSTPNQRVIIYAKPAKDQLYRNFGVYDYVLNKLIQPKYSLIRELEFNGKTIYWAYQISKENQKYADSEMGPIYSQLDVYNEHLKLVRSFKGAEIAHYYNNSEKSVCDPLFLYMKGDLIGAVNALGEEIIPLKYKNSGQVKLETKKEQAAEVFYLFGNELLGVFDCTGKQLIPEKHSQYMSFGSFIIARDENRTYTVYNKRGNQILDGIESYFLAGNDGGNCSYFLKNLDPDLSLSFFVKNDQLFYLQGETFSQAGPGTFEFESAYLRLNSGLIIDQQGKVADVSGMTLKAWKYRCPEQFNDLPIQFSNQVLKPKEAGEARRYNWQRGEDRVTRVMYWEVKNHSGVKLNDRKFDYPFNSESAAGKIYRVNGKYGLMREHFEEVLPPLYDYIYPSHGLYVAFQKTTGLWTCFTPEGKASPDTYDVISLHTWKGGIRLVFKGGKVAILSDSATYLVPLTDSAEFIRKYDLVKMLQLDKQDAFDLKTSYNLVSNAKPEAVYKQINNAQVWWYSYHYSTHNAIMRTNPADVEFLDNFGDLYFRFHELISKKDAMVVTPYYYTERIQSHSRSLSSYSDFSSYPQYRYSGNNFKIVSGKLVSIGLKNLIPDQAAMKRLDALLIKELNEKQYFGRDCMDMDAKIARLKDHFLLTSYSLVFYWPDLPLFQVELYFGQLKGILSPAIQKQVSEF